MRGLAELADTDVGEGEMERGKEGGNGRRFEGDGDITGLDDFECEFNCDYDCDCDCYSDDEICVRVRETLQIIQTIHKI